MNEAILGNSIKSWPKFERPRELLLEKGPGSVSDAGLVAILLRTGIKGKNAVSLARELLNSFGRLRKAIGAKKLDIISQFLIESIVMSLIGGFLGIIFGATCAMIIAIVSDLPRNIPSYSLLLATAFSIIVGISFGIGPAFKASRLDPIEAIRYE